MRKLVSLFTVLMLASMLAFAQTRPITGKVVDEAGQPISNASIQIKGSKTGASADANGNFTINAKTGDVLLISAVGAADKQVTVLSGSTVSVTLPKQSSNLSEVVVTTSLGIVRQAKSLGYSTASVKSTELIQARPVNLQNGLTGKVSGLNIQTTNAGVFGDTKITLRGIRSLTGNNNPLLILDGVPLSLNYLSSLNSADVADVTILKSSSATAVYGPDGVNGAIVVTTKKGNRNKPTITFSQTTQMETVSFMPKLQTTFGSGSSVDTYGYGVYDPIENQCYGPQFDGSMVQIGRDDPNGNKYMVEYSARPDEKRKFWNKGVTNQTDISFSTGDFYLSAQNVSIKGITPKDVNNRRVLRISANKEYGRFKATFNANYTNTNYNVAAGDRFGNGRDFQPYWMLINSPMQIPITRFKDWKNDYWSNPNGYFNDYYSNPYWSIDNFRANGRTNDLLGNIELGMKATDWLTLTYRIGGTISNGTDQGVKGAFTYSDFAKASGKSIAGSGDQKAEVNNYSANSSRLSSEFFAIVKKDFKDFRFDGLFGYSYRQTRGNSLSIDVPNLGIPGVFNPSVRQGEANPSQYSSVFRIERFFAKLGVNYKGWAFVELTGSNDADSRFSNFFNFTGKPTYFYPGVNASFVLSDAIPALKDNKIMNFLKVRGAISRTANANTAANALENKYSAPYTDATGGFPYGNIIGFSASTTLRRDDLKPEFVTNKELGIEMGFFKNRINIEATAYTQDNTDQILTAAYPASTGFRSAILNAASFVNKGIELDLKLTPLVTIRKVNINFKANYTYTTNEVKKLVEGVDEVSIGSGNYLIVGSPAYTFKLTDYNRDDQGRVIINSATGLPSQAARLRTFGNTLPKHLIGLSLNLDWKGLTFGAVADYRGGYQMYSGSLGNAMDFTGISYRSAQSGRQPFLWPNSVIDDGTGKYVSNSNVYTTGGYNFYSQAINTGVNSNYLSSGAFWKLREVSIGYVFPSKWFANKPVKGATFTLTGRNLVNWFPSSNEWSDPEFTTAASTNNPARQIVNNTGLTGVNSNANGVGGLGNVPPTRIFGANLTINF